MEIGQVFEIKSNSTYYYIQLVHVDKELGELVRVFPESFESTKDDLKKITKSGHKYYVWLFLKKAIDDGLVKSKTTYKLPWKIKKPKQMRAKNVIKGEFINWQLYDTNTWKITNTNQLSKKQISLSPWGIWSIELLTSRLEENWTLENWT